MQNGKGDKPRPCLVPRKQFDDNWEKIFGKDDDKKEEKQEVHKKEAEQEVKHVHV